MHSKSKNKNYLYILQIFRAICVVVVMVHHTIPALKYFNNNTVWGYNYIYELTRYGVDFFLLLSGFIINYTYHFSNKKRSIKQYYLTRFFRIYIPYLPISVLLIALYLLLPNLSHSDRPISTLTSITLLPYGNPALSVAWSLVYEVMFYILFAICIVNKKIWQVFLGIWGFAIILFNYIYPINYSFLIFLNPYCINFIVGYLTSLLVINKIKINKTACLVCIGVITSFYLYHYTNNLKWFLNDRNLIVSFIYVFITYLSVTYYNKKFKNLFFLFFLGNISYSVYLIHNPIISGIVRVIPKNISAFTSIITFVLIISLSIGIGFYYYKFVEKGLVNKLKATYKL